MKTDLSAFVGFPLWFDPERLAIEPGPGYAFKRSSRTCQDIAAVLYAPQSLPPDTPAFYLEHLESAPGAGARVLAENDLAYGYTILPPLRIGLEFAKTHGHSHPPVGGYSFSFPEIYSVASGQMWLLLQKHRPGNLAALEDCVLIRMKPGDTVVIPPNYAHMQINPSASEPSLTAGLFSHLFKPEFDFYKQNRGFAYYLVERGETFEALPNPAYSNPVQLRIIDRTAGTPFEAVDPGVPVWSSLVRRPDWYGFLSRPEATSRKFNLL